MNWWQFLLFPFAVLYDLITMFRNQLYSIGSKKSFEFEANVIAVGNLSVGGTGKTPMVDFLVAHFLEEGKSVAILSRGYGRKTKGFRICSAEETVETMGDEPFTYFEKYGDEIMVTVGEDRALAIPFILAEKPDVDVILLDDAYQHRSVKPSFNILLTTQQRPFWIDYLMPSGRLREARIGANRADAIVVTKSESEQSFGALERFNTPYFQTSVTYSDPVFFFGKTSSRLPVVVVAGLADNAPFVDYVSSKFNVECVLEYADHHHYQKVNINQIVKHLSEGVILLTTEKDYVKLKEFEELKAFNCAYIPIKVKFLKEEERFLQMVDKSLKHYTLNR